MPTVISQPSASLGHDQSTSSQVDRLAERLELGARQLEELAITLSDTEWQVRLSGDDRKIGVVVHHVATMYPLEIELAQLLAGGKPITGVTWADVHELNARHAREHDGVTKAEAIDLLQRNSRAAAAAIRALSDAQLESAAAVSLNDDAPLTCQFFLEDHAVRHSYHHLAGIRAALDAFATRSRTLPLSSVKCGTAIPADRGRGIKVKQQATWSSGDFAVIGTTLQIVGEQLSEAADIRSRHRVLDVAAGNGNATLAAARRLARVTSTDYVPALLDRGRQRAEAEGLDNISFEVADAECLPYPDASFDVVLSTFGVMFAPDHPRAAAELRRVCRPGGRIGLASWTPAGFIGQLLRLVGKYVPPAPGVQSPVLWGSEPHVGDLFAGVADIRHATRTFAFRYESPEHWVEVFRKFYGPTHMAFRSLNADKRRSLEADLIALLRAHDVGSSDGLVVRGEYLETVITR